MYTITRQVPVIVVGYAHGLGANALRDWIRSGQGKAWDYDEWDHYGGFDLNVWKDADRDTLYVTAYTVYEDDDGNIQTNTSDCKAIIKVTLNGDVYEWRNLNDNIKENTQ
jgi:hypothetical protein